MKKFKGFTLVECLVAMAILAIACVTLGGIEASVARTNNRNHFMNTSLANQMSHIEQYEDLASVAIYYGGGNKPVKDSHVTGDKKPPHTRDTGGSGNKGTSAYVQIQRLDASGNAIGTDKYSFPVDVHIMYSRDTQDDVSTTVTNTGGGRSVSSNTSYGDMFSEADNNLRYKYILGHTGS